jgi:hypothetical protein
MPAQIATLDLNGSTPEIEIIIGNAHFARFDFFLYDATGKNPRKIGEGRNDDNEEFPDIFPIANPPLSGLDGHTIFWRAVVSSQLGLPGENYSVIVRVMQGGKIAAKDPKTGLLTDIPPKGFIRLQVR